MIRLNCFEPAGKVFEICAGDLTRHILALGQTGAGKTTALINPVLRQLISWRPTDRERRVGLLVVDGKCDDTVQKIQEYARSAGREEDVVVLSEAGNAYYDFFGGFRELSQVDEFTRRILFGTRDLGGENVYWTECRFGLVQCALVLALAGGPLNFDAMTEFLRSFCYDRESALVASRLELLERLLKDQGLRSVTRRRLELAIAEAKNWRALDDRTRELHRSTLGNALRPLWSPAARDLFDCSRDTRLDPGAVLEGKIVVCSMDALGHPQLAPLLFRALKREFYAAVLSRGSVDPRVGRLCGLIVDELPLVATADDPEVMPVLRSKGGFLISATQSLSAVDEVLGRRRRDMLLSNFCSCFFFGGHENQTDELAMLTLGFKRGEQRPGEAGCGRIEVIDPSPAWQPQPVCPPGALARLRQHEAYVKLASGEVTEQPCWLETVFHDFSPPPPPKVVNDLAEAAGRLRLEDEDEEMPRARPSLLLPYMHRLGHKLMTTPAIVSATWELCVPSASRAQLLNDAAAESMIPGTDQLPSCWLLGALRWLGRNLKLVPFIVRPSQEAGILWIELDPAANLWGEGPLAFPAQLNCWIYPSLWRPLLRRHWVRLLCERPDLRAELLSLPQVAALHGFSC